MSVTSVIKVNLGLALIAVLAHSPGLFFLESLSYVLLFVLMLEVSIVISSIIGLNNPSILWEMLLYQTIIIGAASIYLGYKVIDYAIVGFEDESVSFSIGLTTAFCAYSALLINKTCDHYFRRSCKYLPWAVGIVIGLSEILMIFRFMELRDSLSVSFGF